MSFAVISLINPVWLQQLSSPGKVVESRDFKEHGDNLMRDNNVSLALAQYVRSLEIRPDYADAMVNLGIAYRQIGKWDLAEQWIRRSLASPDGDAAIAHFQLASFEAKRGRYDEAIERCQAALERGLEPTSVWRRQGEICITAGRWGQAKEAYEMALAWDRNETTLYRNMLYRDLPRATADSLSELLTPEQLAPYDLTFIRFMQQHDQEISRTCNDLGICYLNLGDTLRAVERMREALDIWPDNVTARNNVALVGGLGKGS